MPVYDKNQQIIGILGGSYNVTMLSHMLFDDLFDGEGDTLIVNHTGKIITYEDGNGNKNRLNMVIIYLHITQRKIKIRKIHWHRCRMILLQVNLVLFA